MIRFPGMTALSSYSASFMRLLYYTRPLTGRRLPDVCVQVDVFSTVPLVSVALLLLQGVQDGRCSHCSDCPGGDARPQTSYVGMLISCACAQNKERILGWSQKSVGVNSTIQQFCYSSLTTNKLSYTNENLLLVTTKSFFLACLSWSKYFTTSSLRLM